MVPFSFVQAPYLQKLDILEYWINTCVSHLKIHPVENNFMKLFFCGLHNNSFDGYYWQYTGRYK